MMEELSFNIIDIIQNSVSAGASNITIRVNDSLKDDIVSIEIEDDGKGMNDTTIQNIQNPFYTTKSYKKIGLGVPLFKEVALHCEGSFNIESEIGKGTKVSASFKKSHIDLPPIGNIADTILTSIVGSSNTNMAFEIKTDKGSFLISTNDIKEQVGEELSLSSAEVYSFLKDYIYLNISQIMS